MELERVPPVLKEVASLVLMTSPDFYETNGGRIGEALSRSTVYFCDSVRFSEQA